MTYAHLTPEAKQDIYLHLRARYGEVRAVAIIEDRDPEANKDLDRWRTLGQPKREAS